MRNRPRAKYMRLAKNEAAKNLKKIDGGPFGACIVKDDLVLAVARNTVLKNNDPTAHAEINAIRIACRKMKSFDLSGCSIYSTTEPCPMCFSAIHWSKIGVLVYATAIAAAKKLGFNELAVSAKAIKSKGKSKVKIISGFLAKECANLLKNWDALEHKISY